MQDAEGVIKYSLKHTQKSLDASLFYKENQYHPYFQELLEARFLLYKLGLIGQKQDLYGGLAYGNLSSRAPIVPKSPAERAFLISATQTGNIEKPRKEHFVLVTKWNVTQNMLYSEGERKPSSEALTHAILYETNPNIQAIIHIHSSILWNHYRDLGMLATPKEAEYGTVKMANEMVKIAEKQDRGIVAMLGHQDGILAFSSEMKDALFLILEVFATSEILFNHG